MERLYSQIDKMNEKLDQISATLIRHVTLLEDHISQDEKVHKDVNELERKVQGLRGFVTIGGWLMGVIAAVMASAKHFKDLLWP